MYVCKDMVKIKKMVARLPHLLANTIFCNRARGHALEHLLSSGTKGFMNGLIASKLCEWENKQTAAQSLIHTEKH